MSDAQQQKSEAEMEAEANLGVLGYAIITEEPEHKVGNLTRYRIVAKYMGDDLEVEGLGDSRENAVLAALTSARSKTPEVIEDQSQDEADLGGEDE